MNVPTVEVTSFDSDFTKKSFLLGEGIEAHHAVTICPIFSNQGENDLECYIHFTILHGRSGGNDSVLMELNPLFTEKTLIRNANFLIQCSQLDWAYGDFGCFRHMMMSARVVHDGTLTIRKADPDDVLGRWKNSSNHREKLGLILELQIWDIRTEAYLPFELACKYFTFEPYVLDIEEILANPG